MRSPSAGPGAARSFLAATLLLLTAACGDPGREALERGDRLLGEGRVEAAIAEYKLARRQGGESPEVLLRLGHAYAASGDVDESVRHYEALLERDSAYRWQAAADLSEGARRALWRGAAESMVRALQPLADFDLGLVPRDLRLALARHHGRDGEHGLALPLYLSVLHSDPLPPREAGDGPPGEREGEGDGPPDAGPDGAEVPPDVYYEVGRAYEELGGCAEAVAWFDRYLSEAGRRAPEATSARWHLGNCLFLAAEEDRAAGRPRTALEKLERMVELGVPQTVLDRAHYLRGELLLGLGDPEGALGAYREVLRLNPSRSGFLVRRAEERIRDIRYGFQGR